MPYTPTPAENTSYTVAADGDNDNAAAFNVFLEGLADMVEWLRRGGNVSVENWNRSVGTTHNLKRGAWHQLEKTWFGCGDGGNDFVERSQDNGRTWVDQLALLGATIPVSDIAVKQSTGDMCLVAIGTKTTYTYAGGTYGGGGAPYASHALALNNTPTTIAVGYESTAAKFIVVSRIGATGFKFEFSANGIAWTNATTIPAEWTAYTNTLDADIGCTAGRAIAVFFDDLGANLKYRIARSTDGGANWTNANFTPTSFNPTQTTRPVYSAVHDAWFVAGSKTAGGRKTEIIRSTDGGATWTSRKDSTADDMAFDQMVVLGPLLVGVNDDGRIFYSADQGATWSLANQNPITAAARVGLLAGGGGLCAINSADKTTFTTLRFPGAA